MIPTVRIAYRLIAIATLLVFSGCQSLPEASGPRRLQRIYDAGVLRVGLAADLPPLSMINERGEFVGFEIDVVEALGRAMGLEVRFVHTPFQDLLSAIEKDDVDLAISGITITAERNVRVAFAGPYFISGASVLSKSDELAHAETTGVLDRPELRYAALDSSTSRRFVQEVLPQAKLVTIAKYEDGIRMVIDGEVDAMIADYLVCKAAAWRHPDAGLYAMRTPFTIEPLGIALPPDAPLLLNLVQNYLNTLENTGLLGQLKAKWLADGSWMTDGS